MNTRCWSTWPCAAARGLELDRQVAADACIESDPTLVRSILQNLMTNAVEYTPPRGRLEIVFAGGANRFTLTIANSTTGLDPSDLEHFFQRFWRKDAVRTAGVHCGLGLSLSRAFAELLGWQLEAELDPAEANGQRRLRLCLTGPVKP